MASLSFGKKSRPSGKEFRDGTVGEALDDIYADVEAAVLALETLDGLPQVTQISASAVANATGSAAGMDVSGTGFLGGSALAAGTTSDGEAPATAATEITFTAKKPGKGGNDITVKFTHLGEATSVTDSGGNTVTINLNSGSMPVGTAIRDLVNNEVGGSLLVCCAAGPTGNGGGTWVSAPADLSLTGGAGVDHTVLVQVGADVADHAAATNNFKSISDTQIVLENQGSANDGNQLDAGDTVLIAVKVDDTLSNQGITVVVG